MVLFPRAGHGSFGAKVRRKCGNSNRVNVFKRLYPFKTFIDVKIAFVSQKSVQAAFAEVRGIL